MKYRVLCLTLALCLLLTACGGGGDTQSQASLSPEEPAETLLVVDGREVAAWRYLYWLERACESAAAEYEAADVVPDWSDPALAEAARQQALADTVLYATVENWAAQYGCTLTEADRGADPAPPQGLSEAQAEELADVGRLYGKLYTLFCTAGSALAPTAEETAAFAQEQGWYTFGRILVPPGEHAEETAAAVFARLNGAADQAAEFAALTAEYGGGTQTVRLGDGTLSSALEDALAALEVGQCSGILESAEGFSVLRRLEADASLLREAHFDHLLQQSAQAAQVQCTQAYGEIDVAALRQDG